MSIVRARLRVEFCTIFHLSPPLHIHFFMRTAIEYLMLLALGSAAALLLCYLLGARRRALALAAVNSLLGAAIAFIPMLFGVYLPAWAFPICGALGIAGAFLYFFI